MGAARAVPACGTPPHARCYATLPLPLPLSPLPLSPLPCHHAALPPRCHVAPAHRYEPAHLLLGQAYFLNAYGSLYVLSGRAVRDVAVRNWRHLRLLANEGARPHDLTWPHL